MSEPTYRMFIPCFLEDLDPIFKTGSSLSLADFVNLLRNDCGIAKTKGDWHQRICSLRELCWYVDCQSGIPGLDGSTIDDGDDCVQAMRELVRFFFPSLPNNHQHQPPGATPTAARAKSLSSCAHQLATSLEPMCSAPCWR